MEEFDYVWILVLLLSCNGLRDKTRLYEERRTDS